MSTSSSTASSASTADEATVYEKGFKVLQGIGKVAVKAVAIVHTVLQKKPLVAMEPRVIPALIPGMSTHLSDRTVQALDITKATQVALEAFDAESKQLRLVISTRNTGYVTERAEEAARHQRKIATLDAFDKVGAEEIESFDETRKSARKVFEDYNTKALQQQEGVLADHLQFIKSVPTVLKPTATLSGVTECDAATNGTSNGVPVAHSHVGDAADDLEEGEIRDDTAGNGGVAGASHTEPL